MPDAAVSLDDKYTLESGRIFLTGTQALVRLPMMQRQRDLRAGLNTASFISGYRGSPLGGVDQQLWRARKFLKQHHIHFQPGVNEELAATAIWGTQQANLFGDSLYDGIFSLWYGKGPGVDRSGDVFRHGNFAGSSQHGGVLLLAGDDHAAKSSTTAHQCEYAFMDVMVPVLNPAGVQDYLDLGLYGWALSRYSGCWVGFKAVTETVDSTVSCYVDPHRIQIVQPSDFQMPEGGLNIRWAGALDMLEQEERHHRYKLNAALAFVRANGLDRRVIDSPNRKVGIVTAGKSYLDVRQAMDDLGIDEQMAKDIGLSLYKVAMTWPLEPQGIRAFCEGLDEVLVIEEKRPVIEPQIKEQLYNWQGDKRPRVIGKFDRDLPDEPGDWLLPSYAELNPAQIGRAIATLLRRHGLTNERIDSRFAVLADLERALGGQQSPLRRIPHFCSGCPHNTSTKVPEGSRALAGIGCHYMVQWMDRNTETFTQMGGEGVPWVGQAPFSKTKHVFANLGDGTYFHSGLMAIRQAVAADVNITYKILFNDAVAMTGGQPHDGPLNPVMIAHQVIAEGVKRVVVVSDEPEKYPLGTNWGPNVTLEHRDDLDRIQRELREHPGVTVIVYDQTCAAEKRRRRKRGTFPDPAKRVFINDLVCEGCGDCSVQSNCVSVVPLETEFGTKRAIDQSSCNKDFSCVKGFCPSFVTVEGGALRKPEAATPAAEKAPAWEVLPEPELPSVEEEPYGILVTGVGGTGVVTIGALVGMAAHIEGKGCSILDMAGLAQKGGAVLSHLRISKRPEDLHAVRISTGGARLLLGCDLVVAAGQEALAKLREGFSHAVVNTHETIIGDFTRDSTSYRFPTEALEQVITEVAGKEATDFVEASEIATGLLGDSIATNLFMLGYAWQKGLVPVGQEAIEQAIELNGVAVDFNRQAFLWGRRAAHNPAAVRRLVTPASVSQEPREETLDELVERRAAFLRGYQDSAYADRYRAIVGRAAGAERIRTPQLEGFAAAVARYAFKLMAYKDEYEVARLYTDGAFRKKLEGQFQGDYKLKFHLAPPLLAKRDPETGQLKKKEYGPWMMRAFSLLARARRLRGTPFDPFGWTQERKTERRLIAEYEALIAELAEGLTADNHALAVSLAAIPDQIRGYGHIKEANLEKAQRQQEELLASWRNPQSPAVAAE